MFKRIKRLLGCSATLHEAAKRHPIVAKLMGEKPRSPAWSRVEKAHLRDEPTCRACGWDEDLDVHHEKPFHLHPELELDPKNLITLCMGPRRCHLLIGHGGNFRFYNPNVVADAAQALAHPERLPAVAALAQVHRNEV